MTLKRKLYVTPDLTHEQRSERRKAICKDFESGLTYKELSIKHDVSIHYIPQIVKASGLYKGRQVIGNNSYLIIAQLIKNNNPLALLAKDFKVSKQRIYQIYKRCQEADIPVQER